MTMKNPVHPGTIVKSACLDALNLTVTAGAEALGVSRQALSNVVNERTGITPEMAIRLSKAFGSTAKAWIDMQTAYDLAQALKHANRIKVKRYEAPGADIAA